MLIYRKHIQLWKEKTSQKEQLKINLIVTQITCIIDS